MGHTIKLLVYIALIFKVEVKCQTWLGHTYWNARYSSYGVNYADCKYYFQFCGRLYHFRIYEPSSTMYCKHTHFLFMHGIIALTVFLCLNMYLCRNMLNIRFCIQNKVECYHLELKRKEIFESYNVV